MKKLALILCTLVTMSPFAHGIDRLRYPLYSLKPKEHTLTDMSVYEGLVRIEDGSHFKVSSSNLRTLAEWREGDRLVISPNFYFFYSFYTYCIRNATIGTSISANLHLGPSIGNRFAKQVDELEYRTGLTLLTDGSYWIVSPDDQDKFYQWREGDYIIIGASNRYSYKNILINVTLDHFVEANPCE